MSPPVRPLMLLAVCLLALAAGPGQSEDEDPLPKKPTKKIVVDDEATAPGDPLALPDIARAAAAASHPALKKFFAGFTKAHDLLSDTAVRTVRVAPVPLVWGKDKFPNPFGVSDLTDTGTADVRAVQLATVRALDHFEPLAMQAVDRLLNPDAKTDPADIAPLPERLAAAERLLTQVSYFHSTAVDQGKRRGKSWQPIREALSAKLADVRVKIVDGYANDANWMKVREQVARYSERYRSEPEVFQRLASVRLREAEQIVAANPDRARQLLAEFEARFPAADDPVAKRVRKAIADQVATLMAVAAEQAKNDPTKAAELYRTIEKLDPNNATVREKQQELRGVVLSLSVGAWRLPERMSPATARYDSERQAVELMFEGLAEALPDAEVGVRFRPLLTTGRPIISPLARELNLLAGVDWSGPNRDRLDVTDISGTLELLRAKPGLPSAEALRWLAEPETNPARPDWLRLRLSHSHPDARQLLTMKILPARWFRANNRPADDLTFAAQPFGTGPYQWTAPRRSTDEKRVSEVVFRANPTYSLRPNRTAQPIIKEIKFVDLTWDKTENKSRDPVAAALKALESDEVQIVPDVPTAHLDEFAKLANANVATAAVSRRVHLLAFNLRDPNVQSNDLRTGLLNAIDRERILNDVFRAGKPVHKPLTGPFPVGCWAESKLVIPQPVRGAEKLKKVRPTNLELIYPSDDPRAQAACEAIAKQIATASGGNVKLAPEGVAPAEWFRRVRESQRFSVAYMTYDYADDWFPLGLATFLDADAGSAGGRNITGFGLAQTAPDREDDALAQQLAEATRTRDFDGKLKRLGQDIHQQFVRSAPFVPLWQLDRHTAVSKRVKILFDGVANPIPAERLDPTLIFQNISAWEMK